MQSIFKGKSPLGPVVMLQLGDTTVRLLWADAMRMDSDNPDLCLAEAAPLAAEAAILAAEAEYYCDVVCNDNKALYATLFEDAKGGEEKISDKTADQIVRQSRAYRSGLAKEARAKRDMLVAQALRNALGVKIQALRSILYREKD